MKILVCVKVVKGELNPFDESALECALRLSNDVTVLTMGPASCEKALLPLTRLGAKAVLISDSIYAGSDTLATAYVLSEAIKTMQYDIILCGRQSIDGDTAQVGPMLAQMLGCNLITSALKVEHNDGCVTAQTRGGEENQPLPAVVTVERGYVLRFPSIFSKLGTVNTLNNSDLHCDENRCGLKGSPTRVLETFENQRGMRKCKFITIDELLPLINDLSANNAALKPDDTQPTTGSKLPNAWAIGESVYKKACEIAENVKLIQPCNSEEIANLAITEKPAVILWNADLWGRKNAPVVAAILGTGLCADCTHLETDGDTLFMYRPAMGGNITAKIKCTTLPQMATVRTETACTDIIVAGGKGVAEHWDKLTEFAQSIGADTAASRGLVDMNKAPYEKQVGLTGKTVTPRIYIAIGISGAIHHTCAIEGAGTIIAINPDKNARIFDYADYGIITKF